MSVTLSPALTNLGPRHHGKMEEVKGYVICTCHSTIDVTVTSRQIAPKLRPPPSSSSGAGSAVLIDSSVPRMTPVIPPPSHVPVMSQGWGRPRKRPHGERKTASHNHPPHLRFTRVKTRLSVNPWPRPQSSSAPPSACRALLCQKPWLSNNPHMQLSVNPAPRPQHSVYLKRPTTCLATPTFQTPPPTS